MLNLYCERLDVGLWAEPFNALSNLAFLFAAWAAWHSARQPDSVRPPGGLMLLIGLIASIGAGSGLFHTFSTPWARVLDIVPIFVFQLSTIWVYLRRVAGVGMARSGFAVAAFLVATMAARQFPDLLNGSFHYLPAFGVLFGLGVHHYRRGLEERSTLLVATGVFAVALAARTVDQAACPSIPVGTHFVWHVLTAATTYLVIKALIPSWRDAGSAATPRSA
ncbi:MAG: ceramidase domain-containing protein [Chloroflexota bacterium]